MTGRVPAVKDGLRDMAGAKPERQFWTVFEAAWSESMSNHEGGMPPPSPPAADAAARDRTARTDSHAS